jgi:hypothetical protein
MEYKQTGGQARAIFQIHNVLDALLHSFIATKHGAPGLSNGMLVTAQGTKETNHTAELDSSFTPVGRDAPLLISQPVRVPSGQGS